MAKNFPLSPAFGVRLSESDFEAIDRAIAEAPSLNRTLIVQTAVRHLISRGGLKRLVEANKETQTKTPA